MKTIKPLITAIAAFSILLFVCQFFQSELVWSRPDIEAGQWYRILGGNLVHSNYPHLLLNLSGLWIAGLLFIDSMSVKTFIISSIILSLFVGLGLYYFSPGLEKYYGFSGALYGLFIVGGTTVILQKDYVTGLLLYLFIGGKIIWDSLYGASQSSAELIGIPVAVDAHIFGAIGAIFISVGLYLSYFYLNRKKNKT